MTTSNSKKLRFLLDKHTPGTVTLASWLESEGISADLQQYYLRSGWLEALGRGAYRRPQDTVDWRGGLFALQKQANLAIHVGGPTALTLQGKAHYLRLGQDWVTLFSPTDVKLPAWFKKHDWGVRLQHVRTNFLPPSVSIGSAQRIRFSSASSTDVWVSDAERAFLECLYMSPKNMDLVECFNILDGLVNLRPRVVQGLLEQCGSIKVKRLFLYMAEKTGHQWYDHLDHSRVKLGSGDRSIIENGVYIKNHRIIVPEALAAA